MGENGKRLSGGGSGRVGLYEGRAMLNTLGGRFKGGSPTRHGKAHHDESGGGKAEEQQRCASGATTTAAAGEHNRENAVKMERESESLKRKCPDGDVLLQWGQRRRQRNGRMEAKAASSAQQQQHQQQQHHEESSAGSKKAIRADRRVVRAEKQVGSSQQAAPLHHPPHPSRVHSSRSCMPSLHDNAAVSSKRNGEGCNGHAAAAVAAHPNGSNSPSDEQDNNNNNNNSNNNHHHQRTTHHGEKADRQSSSPPAAEDGEEAGGGGGGGGAANGGCNGQSDADPVQDKPAAPDKVNLELFEWPKFLISLSRKEKEDDFLAIKGSKLPQRPKRRSKHVEKILHYCSPGMWLSDLTRERYEVREKKSIKKKPRGLKAMGSVDSDSD